MTLLIDLDLRANSSISFLDHGTIDCNAHDALVDPARARSCHPDGRGASELGRPHENSPSPTSRRVEWESSTRTQLKDEIDKLGSDYAHVIVDCPPGFGLLTVNATVATAHP